MPKSKPRLNIDASNPDAMTLFHPALASSDAPPLLTVEILQEDDGRYFADLRGEAINGTAGYAATIPQALREAARLFEAAEADKEKHPYP